MYLEKTQEHRDPAYWGKSQMCTVNICNVNGYKGWHCGSVVGILNRKQGRLYVTYFQSDYQSFSKFIRKVHFSKVEMSKFWMVLYFDGFSYFCNISISVIFCALFMSV